MNHSITESLTDTALPTPSEFEVCYLWRGDRPHEFESVQIIADAVE